MTATGFLTPEQPRLGVSYQLISLIPPNHQLMQDCNAYGEWSPTEDCVYVPQWLYERIMRTYGGDHTHDDEPPTAQPEAPEIQQPEYEEAQRGFQDQIGRLRMQWNEYPVAGQNIVPPEEDDEVVYSPTVRAITVVSTMRIRVSREDVQRMTESEMVEHVLSQYHNIQDELTQRLDPIMRWAHERWRHYHAVPDRGPEGPTLTQTFPAPQRNAGTQNFWRTELYDNAGDTGVPANADLVLSDDE